MARVIHVLGAPLLPAEQIDHTATRAEPEPGVSANYGAYLAKVSACLECHGPALAGGAGPGAGPNITAGVIGSWTGTDFRRALREGKRPDGSVLKDAMPWKTFTRLTDVEIGALWLYERSLPAVALKQ